jgi:hypothetical protein
MNWQSQTETAAEARTEQIKAQTNMAELQVTLLGSTPISTSTLKYHVSVSSKN